MHMHFQVKDLELGLTEYEAETGRYVLSGAGELRYPVMVIPDDIISAAQMGFSVEPPRWISGSGSPLRRGLGTKSTPWR
jgi:hypothetical protein